MGASITGWGTALPEKILTNADFEARLDTTDAWIVERTGIRERHVGGKTGALAIEASRSALKHAGLSGSSIDLLILSTTTPDHTVPATSSAVHDALGLQGGAFDLNAACAGYVYAMVVADQMLAAGEHRALVVGADCLSSITDYEDRGTAVLFGDGAGAVVLEPGAEDDLIIAYDLGVDGSALSLLYADHGGFIHMDGREVYRRAVRAEIDSITKVLDEAAIDPKEIALFVPHQANSRIVEAVNQRIGIDAGKTAMVLDRTGNTSSASIPLALCDAADAGRLQKGDLVLLSGFGAGMTWASAIIRWGDRREVEKT
jgi:3-oxoacyl-[acyl-carrier-protein] synthase-3